MKGAFCDLGALSRSEVLASPQPEVRLWDLFYGRAAGNLNTFRKLADRMPGTNGDAVEEQIFGQVRPGVENHPTYRRYPIIAAKLPYAAMRVRGRLVAAIADIHPWWRGLVIEGGLENAGPAEMRALAREGQQRFEHVMRPHTLAAMLCQSLYEQIRVLAEKAGKPGLEIGLVTGYGDMSETDVVNDLWEVSRDRLSLDGFIARHGYHGPSEGELSSETWRMNRAPLESLLISYREMDEGKAPQLIEAERREQRIRSERELLDALPATRRAPARLTLKLASRLIPLRGSGKSAFLQCTDVVRGVARRYGPMLAEDGVLERPEDIFMLTLEEIEMPSLPDDIRDRVAERREHEADYATTDVPDLWEGMPERIPRESAADGGDGARTEEPVTGTPVSPGVVTGTARLILDPTGDEVLQPGEILVCKTTDPSWASLMMLASALVIDIGGAMSHGAIVARELGIPCVIGTRNGTAMIRTGDQVRVDGEKGEVQVVEAAS
jgi:phosphohistidine swiveling domain-containing protein